MSDLDEERLEQIKLWWKKNSKSLIMIVTVGLLAVFVYMQWTSYKLEQRELASRSFDNLVLAYSKESTAALKKPVTVNKGDTKDDSKGDKKPENKKSVAESASERLIREHNSSPFAVDSALLLAKIRVEKNDLKGAIVQLQWVIAKTAEGSFRGQLARLRLARVLRDSGQLDKALNTLAIKYPEKFSLYYSYVKGTIYEQQKKCGDARSSYKNSIKILSVKNKKSQAASSRAQFKQLIEHRLENVKNC